MIQRAEIAEKVRQLEGELRTSLAVANAEWEELKSSQDSLPARSRISHDEWFSSTWGVRVSAIKKEIETLRIGLLAAEDSEDS